MGISAGLLNERIRVLKEIHVVSEYGDQDIQYKEKFWCRARHLDKEGTRTEVNNKIFYTNNKQFEVRIYQDIKDTDIIQFYDQFYRIINISPDRPNQRKIITVEIINSFDFPIDAKPIEDEVIPAPDPEPEPGDDINVGDSFVYNGLQFCVYSNEDASQTWPDLFPEERIVILVHANADGNHPELVYSGDIVIPKRVEYKGKIFNVRGINSIAFKNTNVTSVYIPDDIYLFSMHSLVEENESGTFENTNNLYSITIALNRTTDWGNLGTIRLVNWFGRQACNSSIQKIYVREEYLDEWKYIFSDEGSIAQTYDLSDKVYPI